MCHIFGARAAHQLFISRINNASILKHTHKSNLNITIIYALRYKLPCLLASTQHKATERRALTRGRPRRFGVRASSVGRALDAHAKPHTHNINTTNNTTNMLCATAITARSPRRVLMAIHQAISRAAARRAHIVFGKTLLLLLLPLA